MLVINKLLSPLTSSNSDTVLKFFVKIPVTQLKLRDQQLLENTEFRKVYFELLSKYFESNDFTAQYILKEQYLQLYQEWRARVEGEKDSEIHRNRIKFSDDSPTEFKQVKTNSIRKQIE